ncbi:hypothetical protein GCM10020367_70310 [Streptomyces sannanensis]|uniref:Type I-E CRISPR-associated protein Cas6/Cse3/CasE n=1 Tax=Streptomyces sannanensis TaxID=285536 RepID=A0ABP6SNG6_9ACTN
MTTTTEPATRTAWLTRLRIDTRNRHALDVLDDGDRLHDALMRLLPDQLGATARATGGLLFRIDETPAGIQVLAQTRTEPRLDRLPTGFTQPVSKDMTRFLAALRPGVPVAYRIAANPVRQVGKNDRDRRHRKACETARAQGRPVPKTPPPSRIPLTGQAAEDWWLARATANGLDVGTILRGPATALHTHRDGRHPRRSNPGRHRIALTVFEGDAVITDVDKVRDAILTGIGRGRAYGAGLLSIALT